MKNVLLFTPLMLALVMLGSCAKKATVITPQKTEVTFSILGGEIRVPVSTDGAIDVQNNPEWLDVEVTDTALVFKAKPNDSGAVRSADVRLVGDNVEVVMKVTQADKCTYISATPSEVTIPKEGGSETVKLDSDGGNISVVPGKGITATYENGVITVTAPANEGGTINSSLVISCDTVRTVVNVTVEGNICPNCGGSGKVTCSKCGGKGYTQSGADQWGCTKCGGSGYAHYGTIEPGWRDWIGDTRKGSGKMTCPDCHGAGQ